MQQLNQANLSHQSLNHPHHLFSQPSFFCSSADGMIVHGGKAFASQCISSHTTDTEMASSLCGGVNAPATLVKIQIPCDRSSI
jgi:hypothetical protein